jgi:hypothetical protein
LIQVQAWTDRHRKARASAVSPVGKEGREFQETIFAAVRLLTVGRKVRAKYETVSKDQDQVLTLIYVLVQMGSSTLTPLQRHMTSPHSSRCDRSLAAGVAAGEVLRHCPRRGKTPLGPPSPETCEDRGRIVRPVWYPLRPGWIR